MGKLSFDFNLIDDNKIELINNCPNLEKVIGLDEELFKKYYNVEYSNINEVVNKLIREQDKYLGVRGAILGEFTSLKDEKSKSQREENANDSQCQLLKSKLKEMALEASNVCVCTS